MFCFVVEDDAGELVGFVKGTPHDGGVPGFAGELTKIYVLRGCQRQGIGRLLLFTVDADSTRDSGEWELSYETTAPFWIFTVVMAGWLRQPCALSARPRSPANGSDRIVRDGSLTPEYDLVEEVLK